MLCRLTSWHSPQNTKALQIPFACQDLPYLRMVGRYCSAGAAGLKAFCAQGQRAWICRRKAPCPPFGQNQEGCSNEAYGLRYNRLIIGCHPNCVRRIFKTNESLIFSTRKNETHNYSFRLSWKPEEWQLETLLEIPDFQEKLLYPPKEIWHWKLRFQQPSTLITPFKIRDLYL